MNYVEVISVEHECLYPIEKYDDNKKVTSSSNSNSISISKTPNSSPASPPTQRRKFVNSDCEDEDSFF